MYGSDDNSINIAALYAALMGMGMGMGGGFGPRRYRRPRGMYPRPIGPPSRSMIEKAAARKEARRLYEHGRSARRLHGAKQAGPASYPPDPAETRQMRRHRDRKEAKMTKGFNYG